LTAAYFLIVGALALGWFGILCLVYSDRRRHGPRR
jgi:hypothetical protein